jgi:hypothetical protein
MALKHCCNLLTEYTEINHKCSTHIHIGGYNQTKDIVISMYLVAKKIESEIFKLFPKGYEDTSSFKGKNYCGKLPTFNINEKNSTDEAFFSIYDWLSGDAKEYPFEGFSEHNHPSDPGDNSKWYIESRYVWLNFVSFIWGTRRTMEFRVHPPTTNSTKTINWLFITNAILRYADSVSWQSIIKEDKLTLSDILSFSYSERLSNYLCAYIEDLKQLRIESDSVSDIKGLKWCKEDPTYEFSYKGIKELL